MPDNPSDTLETLIEAGFMKMLKKKSVSEADLAYLQVLKEAKGWIAVKQRREPEGQGAEFND